LLRTLKRNVVCAKVIKNSGRYNPKHLFMYFLTVNILISIINHLFPELLNSSADDRRRFWLLATLPEMEKNNDFISAIVNMANFHIWECKLRKESLPVGIFYENLSYSIRKTLKLSKYLHTELQKSNFFVCRHYLDPP